jgi:hypothetical protein
VHLWIDEYAASKEYGFFHRHKRHHEDGINKLIEMYGPDAGTAALQHNLI